MRCCSRCDSVVTVSYAVHGDGDGVEYLVETAELRECASQTTIVVLTH
jgi:hypothetical protein